MTYLIDHSEELALALNAGTQHVKTDATVLLFTPNGYEEERKGSNGFFCLVERSWTNATQWSNFFDRKRAKREAAATILPVYLRKAELAMAGHSGQEIQRVLDAEFRAGSFLRPRGTAMSYMISAGQYLGEPAGRFRPHIMLYSPYSTDNTAAGTFQPHSEHNRSRPNFAQKLNSARRESANREELENRELGSSASFATLGAASSVGRLHRCSPSDPFSSVEVDPFAALLTPVLSLRLDSASGIENAG